MAKKFELLFIPGLSEEQVKDPSLPWRWQKDPSLPWRWQSKGALGQLVGAPFFQ